MVYLSNNNLWESKIGNIVFIHDKVQDTNFNQLKLEVNDIWKNEKLTTNIEPSNKEDVINKAYLDEKVLKVDDHLSFIEKNDNEFKI